MMQDYPDAISYKDKFLGNFGDLCKIFGNELLNENVEGHDLGLGANTDHNAFEMELEGFSGDLQYSALDDQVSDQHRKRAASMPLEPKYSSKAQKPNRKKQIDLPEMVGVAVATTLAGKKENKNHTAIENAIDALQAIPDIDDEMLLDACDLLEDERKAKTFLALDFTLRKKWLLRKLR